MAFPTIAAGPTTTDLAASTSHSVNLPTHSAGQLLFVVCTVYGNTTGEPQNNSWQFVSSRSTSPSPGVTQIVLWKVAESASETLTVSLSGSRELGSVAYAISNASIVDALQHRFTVTQSSPASQACPGPNSQRTLDTKDYLIFQVYAAGGHSDATAAPTGYGNLTNYGSANSKGGACYKTSNQSNEASATWTFSSVDANSRTHCSTFMFYDTSANPEGVREFTFNEIWGFGDPEFEWTRTTVAGQASTPAMNTSSGSDYDDFYGYPRWTYTATGDQEHYIEWSGTFEELGVPSGETISDVVCDFFGSYSTNTGRQDAWGWGGLGTDAAVTLTVGATTYDLIPKTTYTDASGTFARTYFEGSTVAITPAASTDTATIRVRAFADNRTTSSLTMYPDNIRIASVYGTASGGDYASTTTATSTVTSNLNVARNLIAAPSATSTVTPDLDVQPVSLVTTIAATATVTPALTVRDITPDFASVVSATSTVTGNIDETLRLLASVAITSVLGPNPSLAVTRNIVSATNVVSTVTPILVGIQRLGTSIAATSTTTQLLVRAADLIAVPAATSTVTADVRSITPQFASTIAATSTVTSSLSLGKPFIAAKATGQSPGAQNQFTVPLPTHRAGQMLVVFCGFGDNNSPAYDSVGSTAGWRCERQGGNLAGTDVGGAWYYKIAESASEVLVAESFSTEKFSTIAYTIDDANGYFIRSHNQGLFSATTNPEFRDITLNKARDVISFAAVYGEADSIMTSAPTGYTIDQTLQGGTSFDDGSVSVAIKEANVSSEAPSTATMLNNAAHCTTTFIAYRRDPTETDFEYRTRFDDSTSYFDTSALDPHVIDNDWQAFGTNQDEGFPNWFTSQDGPSGSGLFTDAFWCLRRVAGYNNVTEGGFIEFVTTWEELGLNNAAYSKITSYDDVEIWYEVQNITGSQSGRPGTATNGVLEIVDPNGTTVLIDAPSTATSNTGWLQLTNNVGAITPYFANEPITLRIYAEGIDPLAEGTIQINFEDLRFAVTVDADPAGTRQFSATVSASSTASATMQKNLPQVIDSVTSTSASASLVVNMPTHQPGDLLVAIITADPSSPDTENAIGIVRSNTLGDTNQGWIIEDYNGRDNVTVITKIAFYESEGLTVNGPTFTQGMDAIVYSIRNANRVETSIITGTTWNSALPSVTIGSSEYLAAIAALADGNAISASAGGPPAGFVDLVSASPAIFTAHQDGKQPATTVSPSAFSTPSGSGSLLTIVAWQDDSRTSTFRVTATATPFSEFSYQDIGTADTDNVVVDVNMIDHDDEGNYESSTTLRFANAGQLEIYSGEMRQGSAGSVPLLYQQGVPDYVTLTSVREVNFVYRVKTFSNPGSSTITTSIGPIDLVSGVYSVPAYRQQLFAQQANESGTTSFITLTNSGQNPIPLYGTADFNDRIGVAAETRATFSTSDFGVVNQVVYEFAEIEIIFNASFKVFFATTINASATVTAALDRNPIYATNIASTSNVTGNIDPTRKLITAVVSQSAVVEPTQFNVDRPLVSTTNALSTVDANIGLTVFLDSTTNVVSTVNPNQFYYGFEVALSATSTVTPTLDRQPKFSTTIAATSQVTAQEWRDISREFSATVAATSALDTTAIERQVNWNSVTSVAAAVFPSTPEVDRPLRADFNGFCVAVGLITLAGKFDATVTATSSLGTSALERFRRIESTTNVVSDVGGNIVEDLRFLSVSIVQSAVIEPTHLQIARDMITQIDLQSVVTPTLTRIIEWDTSIALASAVTSTVVVITNTLELTWSETYFYEPEPYILRLRTDSFDNTVTVNEILDPIQRSDGDVLPVMTINTDDDGPA